MNLEPCQVLQNQGSVLVTSPDADFREQVVATLDPSCWSVGEAVGGAEALAMMETGKWQAVLFDRWLPDLDVNELVQIVQSSRSNVEIFVKDFQTGNLLIPSIAPKSTPMRELFGILKRPQQLRIDWRRPPSVPGQEIIVPGVCSQATPLPGMVGTSPAMQRAYRLARLVSPRSTAVLLTGETGTGKELVAAAIHSLSPRARQPFIVVNCAAIPEALLETELFGHTRGAFTGAVQSRLGRVHAANGGTLLLDEIGDLSVVMQAKLLRFLQGGEVQRLGSNETVRVDVRVIAATNADLAHRVSNGQFREDLYYRLAVFPIELEPLRNRPQDILPLAAHFLDSFCQEAGVRPKAISRKACRLLEQYSWPGNVRELRLVVERAFIFSEEEPELSLEHIWMPSSAITLRKS